MAVTLRIVHLGTEPLDGITPLPAGVQVVNDPQLGIGVITLQPGQRFGRFDPGEVPYLAGQQSSFVLTSLTLLSQTGAFTNGLAGSHAGCPIYLSAPDPGGGVQLLSRSRILDILGPPGGNVFTEFGIIPLHTPVPIPPGFQLRFDTQPDLAANPGPAPVGPHLLQMTFDVALAPRNLFAMQPCCPPGSENCPIASIYTGPAQVDAADPPFNATVTGIYFDPQTTVELRPQAGGANLTIGSQTVDSATQISLVGIDPSTGAGPGVYDLAVVHPDCPDAVLVGVLTIT